MPNIYEYSDYRAFIRDSFEEMKTGAKGMSYRKFAGLAGISSVGYLKLVIDGARNLKSETVRKFIKALKLKGRDADFFHLLVQQNQASDPEERAELFERLMTFKRFHDIHRMEKDLYDLFSRWYVPATYELALLPSFQADPKWIARMLTPRISVAEARHALEVLEHLKLLEIDARTKKGKRCKVRLSTPDEVMSIAVYGFQKEMLTLAHHNLRHRTHEEREISGLTIGLTQKQFETMRDRMREFRRSIHAEFSSAAKADAVYQLNLQLFPLSEVDHE